MKLIYQDSSTGQRLDGAILLVVTSLNTMLSRRRGVLAVRIMINASLVSNALAVLPGLLRLPLRRLGSNRHLLVELVDLLESKTLGLVDEEVDEGNAQEAAAEPDEEDLGLEVGVALAVVDEVGGRVGNGPVEEPVGGGAHGEGLGTGLEGEDLAGDDPGKGTPGSGEEEDVDADESDGGLLSGEVLDVDDSIGGLACGNGTNNGNDELRDAHADGAPEEKRTTSPFVNEVHAS